jgi:hypothetical protein
MALDGRVMEKIRQLTTQDIDTYVDHLSRHLPEPGIDGIISQPFPADEPIDKEKFRKKILERWAAKPGDGAWEVAWGIFTYNSGQCLLFVTNVYWRLLLITGHYWSLLGHTNSYQQLM